MALAGLLVFLAGLCLGPVVETDLFFRLAAGEQFLRTGHIVHENLFSFTFPDAPYLDPAWLFDAGAAVRFPPGRLSGRRVGQDSLAARAGGARLPPVPPAVAPARWRPCSP